MFHPRYTLEPDQETCGHYLALEEAVASGEINAIDRQIAFLSSLNRPVPFSHVGDLYETGNDRVTPSLQHAFEWYQRSAEQEQDKLGFFGMARFYHDGRFVQRDMPMALKLFEEAASRGCAEANLMMGWIYYRKSSDVRDIAKSEAYLHKAVADEFVAAMYLLARLEFYRMHFISAFKLFWRCISSARQLSLTDPNSEKLYLLHGKWKLPSASK